MTATSSCPDIIVIGARGSGEKGASDPAGAADLGLGPEVRTFVDGLAGALNGSPLTVGYAPVNYAAAPVQTLVPNGVLSRKWAEALALWIPNNYTPFVASIDEGITVAKDLLARDAARCSRSRFVLAGYSQGAMVMHQLALQLADAGSPLLARVRSVALIADGDMKKSTDTVRLGTAAAKAEGVRSFITVGERDLPRAIRNSTYSLCDKGDLVCDFSKKSLLPLNALAGVGTHLGYADARTAAIGRSIARRILTSAWVVTTSVPAATVGVSYTTQLTGTGNGTMAWRLISAAPPGLTLSTTGILSGRPTTAGTYDISVRLTDSARVTAAGTVRLTVAPSGPPPPAGCTGTCTVTILGDRGWNDDIAQVDLGDVTQIAAGGAHVYGLRRDGTVWATGYGFSGELGNGTVASTTTAVQVAGLTSITKIASSDQGGYAIRTDGTVWAWGDNSYEQIAAGGPSAVLTPVQLTDVTGARQIGGGESFTVALMADGTVRMQGAAGPFPQEKFTTMTPVDGLTDIDSVSARGGQAYGVRHDGTVWAWGIPNPGGSLPPAWVAEQIPGLSGVTDVQAAGGLGGHALTQDGTVYGWGWSNNVGQVGDGTTGPRFTPIALTGLPAVTAIANNNASGYALAADGTMYSWGDNVGQFSATPQEVPFFLSPGAIPSPSAPVVQMSATAFGLAVLTST